VTGTARNGRAGALTTAIVLIAIVAAWEAAVRGLGLKPIVLPAPSEIGVELAANLPWYLGHAWYTLVTTLAGFAVAVVVARGSDCRIAASRKHRLRPDRRTEQRAEGRGGAALRRLARHGL
jgi:NitT/TauT family transport system permease protein